MQKGTGGGFSSAIRQGVMGTQALSLKDIWISEWTDYLAPSWPLPNEILGGKQCIISQSGQGRVE